MIVLDASAAAEMVLNTKKGNTLKQLMLSGERVLSMDLFHGEISSTFYKYVKAGRMTKEGALRLVEESVSLVDCFVPMSDLYPEALMESIKLGHTPYDMFYFVLARRNAAMLFTLDRRLVDLAMRNGLNCVFDAEVAPGEEWAIRAEMVDGRDL